MFILCFRYIYSMRFFNFKVIVTLLLSLIFIFLGLNPSRAGDDKALERIYKVIENTYNYIIESNKSVTFKEEGSYAKDWPIKIEFTRDSRGNYLLENLGNTLTYIYKDGNVHVGREYLRRGEPFKSLFLTGKYKSSTFIFKEGFYNYFITPREGFRRDFFINYLRDAYSLKFIGRVVSYKFNLKSDLSAEYTGENEVTLLVPSDDSKLVIKYNNDLLIEEVVVSSIKGSSDFSLRDSIRYDENNLESLGEDSLDFRDFPKSSGYNRQYIRAIIFKNLSWVMAGAISKGFSKENLVKSFNRIKEDFRDTNMLTTDKGYYIKNLSVGQSLRGDDGVMYHGCMGYTKGVRVFSLSKCK